jgi:hypothetical protein
MQCFIVRVYRREADNPDRLVGVVEEVEKQARHSFTCLDELWAILNAGKSAGPAGGCGSGERAR